MRKICVISTDPSFFNGHTLVNALRKKVEVIAVFKKKDVKGMWKDVKCLYGYDKIPKVDEYLVISGGCFMEVNHLLSGKVSVILSDTPYRFHHEQIDKDITRLKARVFCMPDMFYCCGVKREGLLHPFDLDNIPIVKHKNITLCHSPFSDKKEITKGTQDIIEVFEKIKSKYGFEYKILKGLSWKECLKEKAKCHIFVDQYLSNKSTIANYRGGLAKSGLEAMLFKSLTFTSGFAFNCELPPPPVVWCNTNLFEIIQNYILNKQVMNEVIESQYKWAKTYTSLEYVSNRILNEKN
jgi:hypothetical protein